MLIRRWMWIAWPAFLVAGLLEILVFGLVDPEDLQWFGHPLALSRQGVYSLAFFAFWVLTMVSSALTTLLSMSPFEANRCPVPQASVPRTVHVTAAERFTQEQQVSVACGLVVHKALQGFGAEDAHMALLDLDDAVFHKFREGAAHGFELEAEVAADFFPGHPQHQLRL